MKRVCVYGVVKNGQVVLDAPLALADGTRVVVETVSDPSPVGPDKQFKTEDERREAAEKLILETVGLRAGPTEMVALEQRLRQLRGARD